jgi:poly-beta-hydroxyalkanoate depolymerase
LAGRFDLDDSLAISLKSEPGVLRKVYPGFLQLSAFVSLNPARHAGYGVFSGRRRREEIVPRLAELIRS